MKKFYDFNVKFIIEAALQFVFLAIPLIQTFVFFYIQPFVILKRNVCLYALIIHRGM